MLFNLWAHLSYFLKDFSFYLILLFVSFSCLIFSTFKIYKSTLTLKRKKVFISVCFTIFLFIFIFSLFEAYFRYRYDVSDGLGFLKVNERWLARHVTYNAYNGYFFRNNRNFTAAKTPGVTRIGVFGDSLAFGAGIRNVNNRFSNLLEKKLNESGHKAEIYNLAIPGTGTVAEKQIYEKTKDLNFDIIILSYFLNDAEPEEGSAGTAIIVKNSQRAKILEFISGTSFFLDFLYWRFSSRYQKTITGANNADLAQYTKPDVLTAHQQYLNNMLDEFKSNNQKVVVLVWPFINFIGPNNPGLYANQSMTSFFENQNVPTINMLDYLKERNSKDLMASKFDSHPNELAHKIAADQLYQKILPLLSQN